MSIYGNSYSEFYSLDINPGTTIELLHSILIPSWGISNLIEHQSIVNGVKNFTVVSADHAAFQVIVNIHKYASPATTMGTILGYLHDRCYFKLHTTGNYVKVPGGGSSAKFFITKMKPFYVQNDPPVWQDKLLIEFQSLDPVSAQDTI